MTPKKPAPPSRARKLPLGSVAKAAAAGDGLEAIRTELARRLDDPNLEARDLPGLSREYRLLVAAIEARGGSRKADGLDELAARRKSRRSS